MGNPLEYAKHNIGVIGKPEGDSSIIATRPHPIPAIRGLSVRYYLLRPGNPKGLSEGICVRTNMSPTEIREIESFSSRLEKELNLRLADPQDPTERIKLNYDKAATRKFIDATYRVSTTNQS